MPTVAENNKRIAKNTVLLYFRMLLIMLVSLYTSRIVLRALGVEDFGIYNVVGGVVAMFSILSGSLSSAISRFITFELGKNDLNKLKRVFSASVTIQIILAILIVVVAEIIGTWFINAKMNIAPDRLQAANWVFHFSILTFVVNLINVPYNATIIAHERMSAFAYISILEVMEKLAIAYFVQIAPIDRLIFYAILMFGVALIIRFIYALYCRRHFEETHYHFIWDRQLLKQMFGFAGWNFIGTSSSLLRDQGGNILLNLFFGPVVNAASGIANQVYTALYNFSTNFMTALNPQITKSYASGDYDYLMKLIYNGSRFSAYLLFLISLPVIINADYLIKLWLGIIPDHTVLFVRLILIFAISESITSPLVTAQLATGNIRNYQLIVGGLKLLNLPIAYVCLYFGGAPSSVYIISIVVSQLCVIARVYMLSKLIPFSVMYFYRKVYINIIYVMIVSVIIPVSISAFLNHGTLSFLINCFTSFLSSLFTIYYIGCSKDERAYIIGKTRSFIHNYLHNTRDNNKSKARSAR